MKVIIAIVLLGLCSFSYADNAVASGSPQAAAVDIKQVKVAPTVVKNIQVATAAKPALVATKAAPVAAKVAPVATKVTPVVAKAAPVETKHFTKILGYNQVSPADIQNKRKNADYWSLAATGAEAVVTRARLDRKIANDKDTFKVETINRLDEQMVSGVNYRYDVKIVNADKSIIINAKYIVYYQSWTQTKKVKIISYEVIKVKDAKKP